MLFTICPGKKSSLEVTDLHPRMESDCAFRYICGLRCLRGIMHFLVIYAHPPKDSFLSAIHHCVVGALHDVGHEVGNCDLYAEDFNRS
jgi:hypothetical protein